MIKDGALNAAPYGFSFSEKEIDDLLSGSATRFFNLKPRNYEPTAGSYTNKPFLNFIVSPIIPGIDQIKGIGGTL